MVNNAPQNLHFVVHNAHITPPPPPPSPSPPKSADFIPFTVNNVHMLCGDSQNIKHPVNVGIALR